MQRRFAHYTKYIHQRYFWFLNYVYMIHGQVIVIKTNVSEEIG